MGLLHIRRRGTLFHLANEILAAPSAFFKRIKIFRYAGTTFPTRLKTKNLPSLVISVCDVLIDAWAAWRHRQTARCVASLTWKFNSWIRRGKVKRISLRLKHWQCPFQLRPPRIAFSLFRRFVSRRLHWTSQLTAKDRQINNLQIFKYFQINRSEYNVLRNSTQTCLRTFFSFFFFSFSLWQERAWILFVPSECKQFQIREGQGHFDVVENDNFLVQILCDYQCYYYYRASLIFDVYLKVGQYFITAKRYYHFYKWSRTHETNICLSNKYVHRDTGSCALR